MKKLVICLTAGLLVVGAQSLMAQTSTNSTNSVTAPGEHKGQGKERMAALLKILDLNPADLKDLEPKERRAKVKEAADKFVADLKAKKAAGTLTEEEQANLEKVQAFLAHGGGHKKPADAAPATPPASN